MVQVFSGPKEKLRVEQRMGTFTTYYAIPYGLIAFHGIANENAAITTGLNEEDFLKFKVALWKGVRETISATYPHKTRPTAKNASKHCV